MTVNQVCFRKTNILLAAHYFHLTRYDEDSYQKFVPFVGVSKSVMMVLINTNVEAVNLANNASIIIIASM